MTHLLIDGPAEGPTLLLAHGAGAAMDSAGMAALTAALTGAGLRVVRFEFDYMASRRRGTGRKPPPRAEKVIPEYREAVATLASEAPILIGGKSMGGRVASMIADDLHAEGHVAGLVCFGYPFHPPGKPETTRTAHLEHLATPALIFQGTRDPFGTRDDVAGYALPDAIEVVWLEDGDHDLKPRKTVSGFTAADHLATVAERTRAFAEAVG